jgi:hypothetical protein
MYKIMYADESHSARKARFHGVNLNAGAAACFYAYMTGTGKYFFRCICPIRDTLGGSGMNVIL